MVSASVPYLVYVDILHQVSRYHIVCYGILKVVGVYILDNT